MRQDRAMRGFLIHLIIYVLVIGELAALNHLFVYVAVNALLIVVSLLYTPNYYWFLLPLIGWGLLLTAHGYAAFHHRRQRSAPGTRAARTGAKA
jgi:hypothetical protein